MKTLEAVIEEIKSQRVDGERRVEKQLAEGRLPEEPRTLPGRILSIWRYFELAALSYKHHERGGYSYRTELRRAADRSLRTLQHLDETERPLEEVVAEVKAWRVELERSFPRYGGGFLFEDWLVFGLDSANSLLQVYQEYRSGRPPHKDAPGRLRHALIITADTAIRALQFEPLAEENPGEPAGFWRKGPDSEHCV